MIDYVNKDLFYQDGINKQWIITAYRKEIIDGVTTSTEVARITNEELLDDSITVTESLSSDGGLVFGRCEASSITFTVYNVVASLKNCELTVDIVLNHDTQNPFRLGTYIVDSDKPTADRKHRRVTAYDRLYTLSEKNVAPWYKQLTFPMTMKAFRDSFFEEVGITQETVTLPQDNIQIQKTLDDETQLSAISILNSLCEINGCFGHMRRDDVFKYVVLAIFTEAVYPDDALYPADDLYPADTNVDEEMSKTKWMNAEYEDYKCKEIDAVVILNDNGDVVATTSNEPTNPFKLEGNFLTGGLSSEVLNTIATNLFENVKMREYKPARVECLANPCYEVGDSYMFNTEYDIVCTYILYRSFTGIQLLTDARESTGEEDRSKDLNSISKQLARLNNKSKYDLEVQSARISDLEADHVSTTDLAAVNATITNLNVDGKISAVYATINNLDVDGKISAAEVRVNGNINTVNANLSGTLSALQATVNTINANYITSSYITASVITSKFNNANAGWFNYMNASTFALIVNGARLPLSLKQVRTSAGGSTWALATDTKP